MENKAERKSSPFSTPMNHGNVTEISRNSDSPKSAANRFSTIVKLQSFKRSGFGGAAELQESKTLRSTKNEELAQSWDGTAYQVNSQTEKERDQIDTDFILFNQLPAGVKVLSMGCTEQSTFVLTTQGMVYSWGASNNTLGRPVLNKVEAKKPDQIKDLNEIIQLVCGHNHVMALDIQGCVYVWGSNQFGQLGVGPTILALDKPTVLEFLEDTITQIYAGPHCSFAVTKQGQLYSWGQNSYGQLGQIGSNLFFPKFVSVTPWNQDTAAVIVTGKAHIGYAFTTSSSTKLRTSTRPTNNANVKQLEIRIKELEENVKNLVEENRQLSEKLVGEKPTPKLLRDFEEDAIIRQLKEDHKSTLDEKNYTTHRIAYLKNEIEGLDDDLNKIQGQLTEIIGKENTLSDELHRFETELSKKEKSDRALRETERAKKATEDLLKSNEQIKNVIQKKQNERDEKRQDLASEKENLIKKRQKLDEREKMFLNLIAERKSTIAQGAFTENKRDILKLITELYDIFGQAKEHNIEDMMKTIDKDKGLIDALYNCNEKLIDVKKNVDRFKVHQNDALYDVVSKTLEMFQDNINTRIKMNDYSYTVLLHLNDKMNDPGVLQQTHKRKIPDPRQSWAKEGKEGKVSAFKQRFTAENKTSKVMNPSTGTASKSDLHESDGHQRRTVGGKHNN